MRDFSWLGERYRRSFWCIQVGPEAEEMGDGDGEEMVAEVDASVISMSAEVSDVVIPAVVDVDGSEVGAATAAVTVSAASTEDDLVGAGGVVRVAGVELRFFDAFEAGRLGHDRES